MMESTHVLKKTQESLFKIGILWLVHQDTNVKKISMILINFNKQVQMMET
jgi:hypothetical protein